MIRPTDPMVHSRVVEERFVPGLPGFWVQPEWASMFPWLVQGVTGGDPDSGSDSLDFGLFSTPPRPEAEEGWKLLAVKTGMDLVVHARQVHGDEVHVHRRGDWGPTGGLRIVRDGDGHLTQERGILLGVVGADCVPVFLVDTERHAVGAVHAGWRGVVAGILPEAILRMRRAFGTKPEDLLLHFGPAVCGDCYEVGEEVWRSLCLPYPGRPSPVDLRAYLAGQAVELGVSGEAISRSRWCTLCGPSPFFSHRGGDEGRHLGFVGIRKESG